MSSGKSTKKYSTDELRSFYFSKATNFTAFNKSGSVPRDREAASLSQVEVSVNRTAASVKSIPSPVTAATPSVDHRDSALEASPPAPAPAKIVANDAAKKPAGSALSVVKASTSSASNPNATGESVSPAYILFLRQQQDLVKSHCAIDEVLHKFFEMTAAKHDDHVTGVSSAADLLHEAENSTDWNWKSKFNEQSLNQDAGLTVPADELKYAEDVPKVVEMQYQQQQLVKLKQVYCGEKQTQNSEFRLVLENGIRRLERLTKEYSASQLDATPVVRVSDNLLVQLDHILSQPSLDQVLREVNDNIIVLSQKQKECMSIRDQAHEDGAMDIAERESFRLADISEELADAQVHKIQLLQRALDECNVSSSVRDSYSKKAQDDGDTIERESSDLKNRCEADLARLYQLQKQVEEAESMMRARTATERDLSEQKLKSIADRQQEAWDQINALVKLIRQLEVERHNEVKRRIEEKVKDETRQNEFKAFMTVANAKAVCYDRTIKNCDTNTHCCKLMTEFLQSGFFTIQKSLSSRKESVEGALFEAQKCHLAVFRSLLFTLGDLEYKKERRIEEVGEHIQAAHIQQEMCNDSLNPNAKKFSDAKKDLLRVRDELELELRDIRDRQSVALDKYEPTERALNTQNYPHTHPLSDLEERQLNTRAKMVEYKAMALGHVSSLPLKRELNMLKQSLDESRRVISRSSIQSTMPL